jgi:hypothetical protein
VGHSSRSSGLLHVKASLATIFQSDLKTGGDATAGGAVHIAPSRRLRQSQVEDG